jgi:hypothetical protein
MLSRRSFVGVGAQSAAGVALGQARTSEDVGAATQRGKEVAALASDLTWLSLGEASDLVRRKKVSPVELASACLQQIELLNPALNA